MSRGPRRRGIPQERFLLLGVGGQVFLARVWIRFLAQDSNQAYLGCGVGAVSRGTVDVPPGVMPITATDAATKTPFFTAPSTRTTSPT